MLLMSRQRSTALLMSKKTVFTLTVSFCVSHDSHNKDVHSRAHLVLCMETFSA
jgi:hypothetical protein